MNWIIMKVAFRNIFLHRLKTLIVGSILVFGSFLAVLGNCFVDAISGGMKNSVTESVTGDIQIFSEKAKEKLSVFGNMDGSPSDVGFVKNFAMVHESLMKLENVKAVVPMGANLAIMNPGNLIDIEIENLRKLYKSSDRNIERIELTKEHLFYLMEDLKESFKQKRGDVLFISQKEQVEAKESLEKALDPSFLKNFDEQYEQKLEFIGNKIAPLIFDDNMLFFNYVGTDPESFQKHFPQFEIVKGQMIPEGKKGFLIHDYIYENFVKHRIARRLDAIKKEIEINHKKISSSKELQDLVKANKEQLVEIYLQMSPREIKKLTTDLKEYLKSSQVLIRNLLTEFFEITDLNFSERYKYFYDRIAPHILLYKVKVGDIVPLTAFTKLGTSSAVNIKIYGTFHFKSFKNSPLAGNFSIIDLVTFRELYGFMTESRKKQNFEIEQQMGATDISRENIESLFGNPEVKSNSTAHRLEEATYPSQISTGEKKGSSKSSPQKGGGLVVLPQNSLSAKDGDASQNPSGRFLTSNQYTKEELQNGVFLNAAVLLKNPSQIKSTLEAIKKISVAEELGIQAISWQEASGVIGQMTLALKVLLFTFVGILLGVAALMIMNSLLMATLDREKEIGTMRAIGASKGFVYRTFLFETFLTSLLFGGIGSFLALVVIWTVGRSGIPATGDVAQFFFSGPRLFLSANYYEVIFVILGIMVISFCATQYPAWRAMKISPLKAMLKKE